METPYADTRVCTWGRDLAAADGVCAYTGLLAAAALKKVWAFVSSGCGWKGVPRRLAPGWFFIPLRGSGGSPRSFGCPALFALFPKPQRFCFDGRAQDRDDEPML